MGNYKKKLIKFIKLKNDKIVELTGISYINNEDIKDIESWQKKDYKRVYEKIKSNINTGIVKGISESSCPWCILLPYTGQCEGCGYGERHGYCVEHDSLYGVLNSHIGIWEMTNKAYKNIIYEVENQ